MVYIQTNLYCLYIGAQSQTPRIQLLHSVLSALLAQSLVQPRILLLNICAAICPEKQTH